MSAEVCTLFGFSVAVMTLPNLVLFALSAVNVTFADFRIAGIGITLPNQLRSAVSAIYCTFADCFSATMADSTLLISAVTAVPLFAVDLVTASMALELLVT